MADLNELKKIKFMPLANYDVSTDTKNEVCAVEVTDMFGAGLTLDWSRAVGLALGTTYVIGSGPLADYRAGYIWCGGGRGGYRWCNINGITFLGGYDYQDGHEGKLIVFPVSTGDSVRSEGSVINFTFIPTVWSL